MSASEESPDRSEIERLVAELEQAEAYEQRLRQLIVEVRDALAAGNQAAALSMLNAALNDIDAATDVVTPHRPAA
jgi:ribosomal protein S20